MRHDELYVADLVDSARAVREYLDGVSREHWDEDRVLRDAVRDLVASRASRCRSWYVTVRRGHVRRGHGRRA